MKQNPSSPKRVWQDERAPGNYDDAWGCQYVGKRNFHTAQTTCCNCGAERKDEVSGYVQVRDGDDVVDRWYCANCVTVSS